MRHLRAALGICHVGVGDYVDFVRLVVADGAISISLIVPFVVNRCCHVRTITLISNN
jgi:hypothetical protein